MMAKAVHDIIAQLEGLEPEGLAEIAAKAQEIRQNKLTAKREEFIARMREEAAALDLVPSALASMLVPSPARSTAARKKGNGVLPPKYRDGARSWTGRGKTPSWLSQFEAEGRNRKDFLVAPAQEGKGR
jgi:DNA-binding protein H-NS